MTKPNLDPHTLYTWGGTIDEGTCPDCRNLNGQTHPGKYWIDNDLYPGGDKTECDGSCRCELTPEANKNQAEGISFIDEKDLMSTFKIPHGLFLKRQYSVSGSPEYHARFVQAGKIRGKGGYDPKMSIAPLALERAVVESMFENKAVFVDHAGFFDYPSLDNLAGTTLNAQWNSIDQSVEGTIRLNNTPAGQLAAKLIDDLLANPGIAPDVGLSMVCYPTWEHTDEGSQVIALKHVESVDLVFEPAAEGRILAALSAHTLGETIMPETNTNPQPDQQDPMPAAQPWMDAIQQATITAMVNASGLPQASCNRLNAQHYDNPDQVAAAIESERDYLASLRENNVISMSSTPPRSPQITGMQSSLDRLELALDALLAGTNPPNGIAPLSGIREFYHLLSGDYEMTGMFQPDRLHLANVNSSTMANLVANVLNKRVINEFQVYPHWWDPIVTVENFQSLQQVKWITLGGIGELPTVAEGAAYTELTWDDNAETADFVKKGGYLGITLETIDKDDTGQVRAAPRALAQAAWLTLSKSVSDIFTYNSGVGHALADGDALFHSNHSNLGSTALSITTWEAAKLAMRKQTELHSGERLGGLVVPKYLLVPPDLETTAIQILASEYQYTYALSNGTSAPINVNASGNGLNERLANARQHVITVDLWTDANDWAAVADPRMYPTIGVAFRYGNTPEIFSVASPTAGLMFTNDTLPVKVRYFYACGAQDYRGLYKANVA